MSKPTPNPLAAPLAEPDERGKESFLDHFPPNVEDQINAGTKSAHSLRLCSYHKGNDYQRNIIRSAQAVLKAWQDNKIHGAPGYWDYQTQFASGKCLWVNPYTEESFII